MSPEPKAANRWVVETAKAGAMWMQRMQGLSADQIAEVATRVMAEHQALDPSKTSLLRALWFYRYHCQMEWYRYGLPRVTIGHKHAAALMVTNIPRELCPEVRTPWPTFVIDVPDGLLTASEAFKGLDRRIRHVVIHRTYDTSMMGASIGAETKFAFRVYLVLGDEREALFAHSDALASLADTHGDTADTMVARFVLGVCIELTEHRPAQAHATSTPSVKHDARGAPVTTTFVLARNVTLDARQLVRDACAGEGHGSPTVQGFVRGHWKRQPHGVGHAERRWIFVEPYWRGPDDAPIALRFHVLTGPKSPRPEAAP